MKLADAVVLVTGANRGIGLAFAREALARGARRVYAGARDPHGIALPGGVAIPLDVTDPESVAHAARECGDVNVLADEMTRGVKLSLSTAAPAYLAAA